MLDLHLIEERARKYHGKGLDVDLAPDVVMDMAARIRELESARAAIYDEVSRDIQQAIRCSDGVDRLKLKNKFAALGQKYADKARELR